MTKLKVKFIRYKNLVIADILEMPEELRGKGELIHKERSIQGDDNDWIIHSIAYPSIYNKSLYLSGNNKEIDNIPAIYNYRTVDEAKEAVEIFSELIHKLNLRIEEDSCPEVDIDNPTIEQTIAE